MHRSFVFVLVTVVGCSTATTPQRGSGKLETPSDNAPPAAKTPQYDYSQWKQSAPKEATFKVWFPSDPTLQSTPARLGNYPGRQCPGGRWLELCLPMAPSRRSLSAAGKLRRRTSKASKGELSSPQTGSLLRRRRLRWAAYRVGSSSSRWPTRRCLICPGLFGKHSRSSISRSRGRARKQSPRRKRSCSSIR